MQKLQATSAWVLNSIFNGMLWMQNLLFFYKSHLSQLMLKYKVSCSGLIFFPVSSLDMMFSFLVDLMSYFPIPTFLSPFPYCSQVLKFLPPLIIFDTLFSLCSPNLHLGFPQNRASVHISQILVKYTKPFLYPPLFR